MIEDQTTFVLLRNELAFPFLEQMLSTWQLVYKFLCLVEALLFLSRNLKI